MKSVITKVEKLESLRFPIRDDGLDSGSSKSKIPPAELHDAVCDHKKGISTAFTLMQ